ncbi:MAG TPA: CPBP family glutamic-type intramembrane protease [Verrucomicrobiae bacterium]|jgi:membrane protease YdiL (CAAX protease family)|nr:CPBP family glutamic-type intramembrane protease [Verrucomicrobiae bacterium]
MTPPPESLPPIIGETKTVSRGRWAIHLVLIASFLFMVAAIGMNRGESEQPALTHSVRGLLRVCAGEIVIFGGVFALAWLASRASVDDLLLRWRGNVMPILLGIGYSVALRIAVGVVALLVAVPFLLSHSMTKDSIDEFVTKNRPRVETAVDVAALRDNPAYLWLSLTVVSFIVAGLREELWRASFLAGMKGVWPKYFSSRAGQIGAVIIGAIIFGLGHLAMGGMAAALAGLLGVGLGLIMVLHRSIWPAVLAHGFFDATSMALLPWGLEMAKHLSKH